MAAAGTTREIETCSTRRSRRSESPLRLAPCRGTAAARGPRASADDPKHAWMRAELSTTLPWVIATPLGFAVEPEVYWRKASVSRVAHWSVHCLARLSAAVPLAPSRSVYSTASPARSGTPANHRAESLRRDESVSVRMTDGRASAAIDCSRVMGRRGRRK